MFACSQISIPAMKSAAKPPASFEAALQELETIVQSLESGGTALEASLQAYERGMLLMGYCENTLAQADQKIRLLQQDALRDFQPVPGNES